MINHKQIAQDKMRLKNTIQCAEMYKNAVSRGLTSLVEELFILLEVSARDEWGPDTVVDDYSEGPDKILVINGKKLARI